MKFAGLEVTKETFAINKGVVVVKLCYFFLNFGKKAESAHFWGCTYKQAHWFKPKRIPFISGGKKILIDREPISKILLFRRRHHLQFPDPPGCKHRSHFQRHKHHLWSGAFPDNYEFSSHRFT